MALKIICTVCHGNPPDAYEHEPPCTRAGCPHQPQTFAPISRVARAHPYRPSNGTEGEWFMSRWCERCERDRAFQRALADDRDQRSMPAGCEIAARSFRFDEPLPEWVADDALGTNARCTAFQPYRLRIPGSSRRRRSASSPELPLGPPQRKVRSESAAIYAAVRALRALGYEVWRCGKHHLLRGQGKAVMLESDELKAHAVRLTMQGGER